MKRFTVIIFFISTFSFGLEPPLKSENQNLNDELPVTYNDLFAGSGTCLQCHNSQVNQLGESISIVADWRSTMMANSARDPFWRAKVSHEGLVNPEHKAVLEDVCTRCHAPVGNLNAHYNGHPLYSVDEMQEDPLALDGVQCTVCHQIEEESLGNYSGTFNIGEQKIIWGPYTNPFTPPMINTTGYTPEFGGHINDSRLCGSCHTLITNAVDNNGQPTGNEFVEQAIYQEWKNSNYPADNKNCSSCHVPRITDPVKISSMPPWLDPRTPFGMHHFQGANVFITTMIKDHADVLNVTASSVQLDSTIARNLRSLQQQTIEMNMQELNRTEDTLYVDLNLVNKSGHKFPSGYPSRRFFVELIVVDANDQIIFHSGSMDDEYQIIDEDETYENHYNIIHSDDQVQIYEMVMGDINNDVTTVLERANFHLKDNRIPPEGFTTSHASYDTVSIVGNAVNDTNFNWSNNVEGSGSDIVHFHIPTNGYQQMLKIKVKLYYQTVSSKWLEHMFTYSSPEIDAFKAFYESADKTPVQIAIDSMYSQQVSVLENTGYGISVYPNPTSSKIAVNSNGLQIKEIVLYDNSGEVIEVIYDTQVFNNITELELKLEPGLYFIQIITHNKSFIEKIILQ